MSIHQEISFGCESRSIFEALTNSEMFGQWAGSPSEIVPEAGGNFSCFGGLITGMSIEVVASKRLVQAWRVSNWESGIYSIVKFDLEEISGSETKLVFDHTGFPEEHRAHLEQGWHNKYWEPMRKYLEV
ncbi:MAG: SRPBCC domain-containing protein [Pseudomonadales bacterium]